ncbi:MULTISPECIES: helix-turn-helix domain-containing protein [unclassified Enterococcus]|uniref:helix-turn-helix domain-containing protein n=1 Tax=unclassified Enterococcus TaxID=2608891 RepID=UPI0013EC7CEC|nr:MULTISPECIES: helix-turn-helix domain-containing protein [unclassified Enterococcus]
MKYLHKAENQEVEILKYLGKNSNRWLTSEEIGEHMNLSRVTVNKIIKSLQSKIEEDKHIYIEIVQNKGVLFNCSSSIYIADLIQKIYSNSLTFKLITSLLNESIVSLDQFAYKNFISLASIRRKIAFINEILKDSNIAIRNNRFVGDEQNIRGFLFKYYWEIFKGRHWPFSNVDKAKLIENSERVSMRLEIWCSQVSYEQIYYLLAISRIRVKKAHIIDYKKEFYQLTEGNDMFEICKEEWYRSFPQLYCPESEFHYYFFVISSFSLNYVKTNVEKLIVLKEVYGEKDLFAFEITKYLFKNVEKKYKLENLEKKHPLLFLELVMCHSKAFIVPSKVLITSSDSFYYKEKMAQNYPEIFKNLNIIISDLKDKFPQIIYSESFLLETYCMIHFQALRNFFLKKMKILVSVSSGRTTEQTILGNITQHFKEKYLIEETFDENKADICITDGQLKTLENNNIFYIIDTNLGNKDFLQIETILDN